MSTKINIGMSESQRKSIAEGLSRLLADSYTLYLKTHNFHWNVTGPHFSSLHLLFETQYTELATAVDSIAERIRALGFPAPGSYQQFAQLTCIKEETQVLDAMKMVAQLLAGHEAVVCTARSLLSLIAEAQDQVSDSLISDRMAVHEKTAWMLRSLLA